MAAQNTLTVLEKVQILYPLLCECTQVVRGYGLYPLTPEVRFLSLVLLNMLTYHSKRRAQIGSEWRLRQADSEDPSLYDIKGKLH